MWWLVVIALLVIDRVRTFPVLSTTTRRATTTRRCCASYSVMDNSTLLAPSSALDELMDVVEALQRSSSPSSIRTSTPYEPINGEAPPLPINSIVFDIIGRDNDYILAILGADDKVNVTALEQAASSVLETDERRSMLVLADPATVETKCGFAPGTVPPLGLSPPPLLTIVDRQVTESSHLLGGGGRPQQSLVLASETLLTQPRVVVGAIGRYAQSAATAASTPTPLVDLPKPFFAVAPPPRDVAERVLVQKGKSDHIPLQPTAFSVVGRLSGVRQLARLLVFGDLAPVHGDYQPDDHPWRCALSGEDMAVQLICGKTLVEKLGGEEAAAPVLKQLKVGQLVLVTGVTNVRNRESLKNWVKKKSLDLVVSSIQVLHGHDEWRPIAPPTSGRSSVLGLASRSKPTKQKSHDEPGLSYLSMSELYGPQDEGDEPYIHMVDCLEAIEDFASSMSELLLSLATKKGAEDPVIGLVGIDCEWKPNFLLESSNMPQPVLVLQICLHPLKKVYLFDLQKLFRPLLLPSEPMMDTEVVLSEVLTDLLQSKRLVKTGFQLMADLRRLAASYPHVPAFQEVNAVLEASTLAKKVMQLTKLKNARVVTSSLSRLTEKFLGKTINKDQQVSDWSLRPLTPQQVEYAALDAVVTPAIVETLMEKVEGHFFDKPQFGRWPDDTSFKDAVSSFRFLFLDTEDARAVKKLNAKRIIGNPYVVTQYWVTGNQEPGLPSVPASHGDGPYTDASGTLRIPSQMVAIRTESFNNLLDMVVGEPMGRSKDNCIKFFLVAEAALTAGARLDFAQRSGYVEFADAVALFVNMPNKAGLDKPRSYANEWEEEGRILTWFLRESEWRGGTTPLARKLVPEHGATTAVILFVRMGKGQFVCCGRCEIAPLIDDDSSQDSREWDLVQLNLNLLDFDKLKSNNNYQALVHPELVSSDEEEVR